MRLEVKGVGSVTLPYDWSQEGAAKALPRIQHIFKHFATGRMGEPAKAKAAAPLSDKESRRERCTGIEIGRAHV